MFAEVAEALEAAHEAGVIHRDIKPSNLMLDGDGSLHITDFGVARLLDDGGGMTMTGEILGTPVYMSPEQARAKSAQIDHRTDVYSLGATLYETLTLRPPFASRNVAEVYRDVLSREPSRPRTTNRDIPQDLETIVLKAMQKDAGQRYASAAAFARDLRAFAEGRPVGARRIGPLGRAWRMTKRHRKAVAVAGLVLALVTAAVWLQRRGAEETDRRRALEYERLVQAASNCGSSQSRGREAVAYLERAIRLDAERHEAHFLMAMLSGRGFDARLASLERAAEGGLDRKVYLLCRANLLRHLGDEEAAQAAEGAARGVASANPAAAYLAGDRLAELGLYDEAEAAYTQALDRAETGSWVIPTTIRARANLRMDRADAVGALADFQAAAVLMPGWPSVEVPRAELLRRQGSVAEAERVLEGAIEATRRSGSAARWDSLLQACERWAPAAWQDRVSLLAVEAHPQVWFLWEHRVGAQLRVGKLDGIVAAAERARDLREPEHGPGRTYAIALYAVGRYEEAEAAFASYRSTHPEDGAAAHEHAETLAKMGRAEEALTTYDRAIDLSPNTAWATLTAKARFLCQLMRLDEAEEALRKSLALNEGFGPTYVALAHLRFSAMNHRGAIEAATRALELDPGNVDALYWRGAARVVLSDYEAALPDLQAAVRDGRVPPARESLGTALVMLGRPEEAVREYRELLRVPPTDEALLGRTYAGLAHALKAAGRVEEALAALREGAKRLPQDSGLLFGLVSTLLAAGRAAEALPVAQELSQRAGRRANGLAALASAAMRVGELELAIDACEVLLSLPAEPASGSLGFQARGWGILADLDVLAGVPVQALEKLANGLGVKHLGAEDFHPELLLKRVSILMELERYAEAEAAIDAWVAASPSRYRPLGLVHRARLAAARGDRDTAVAMAEQAVERMPQYDIPWLLLSTLLARTGRSEAAAAVLERALERLPDSAFLTYRLGWMRALHGRVAEGLRLFDDAIPRLPAGSRPVAEHGRAQLLCFLGRFEEALDRIRGLHDGLGLDVAQLVPVLRGYCLAHLGRPSEAQAELEAHRMRWPRDAQGIAVDAWLALGDAERAVREAEVCVERDPMRFAPRLVQALRAAGRIESSERAAWKYAGRDPAPDDRAPTAYLAAVAGSPGRARELLRGVRESERPGDHLWRARIHHLLGEEEEARSWLEKARQAGWIPVPGAAPDPDLPR